MDSRIAFYVAHPAARRFSAVTSLRECQLFSISQHFACEWLLVSCLSVSIQCRGGISFRFFGLNVTGKGSSVLSKPTLLVRDYLLLQSKHLCFLALSLVSLDANCA